MELSNFILWYTNVELYTPNFGHFFLVFGESVTLEGKELTDVQKIIDSHKLPHPRIEVLILFSPLDCSPGTIRKCPCLKPTHY